MAAHRGPATRRIAVGGCLLCVALAAGAAIEPGELGQQAISSFALSHEDEPPRYYVVPEGQSQEGHLPAAHLQEDKSQQGDPTMEVYVTDQPDFDSPGSRETSSDARKNAGPVGSASISTADSTCKSISSVVSDYWCATNCENSGGSACPEDACKCATKKTVQPSVTKAQEEAQVQVSAAETARAEEERQRLAEDAKRVADNDAVVSATWGNAAGVHANAADVKASSKASHNSKNSSKAKVAANKTLNATKAAFQKATNASKGSGNHKDATKEVVVTDEPDFVHTGSKPGAADGAPEAKNLASASISTADSTCVSINSAASDYWCATNCETGGSNSCPETMCKCGVKKNNGAQEEYLSRQKLEVDRAEQARAEAERLRMEEDAKRVAADDAAREASWQLTDPSQTQNAGAAATKEVVVTDKPESAPSAVPGDFSKAQTAASAPEAKPLATASISTADSNCVSISPSSSDYWCATNCLTGSCPATMCKCGDGTR